MVPTEATVPHPIQKTSGEGTVLTVPYALPTVPQTEKVLDIVRSFGAVEDFIV